MLLTTRGRLFRVARHLTAPTQTRRMASTVASGAVGRSAGTQGESEDMGASPVPPNPLGEGRWIKSAACLIIGDEILNGKTHDTNSHYFARFCFEQGIELERIEVIADDEEEIIEASRRMVKKYDFVITSGGIGPTHDDITYESLAKAFNQRLVPHDETLRRMGVISRYRTDLKNQTPEQRAARERMAYFPEKAEVLYVNPDMWVPVIRLEGKLCILPGIPKLFQRLIDGLVPYLPLPPPSQRAFRHLIFTKLAESNIAPFLTSLQKRVRDEGIQVGSYPLLLRGVTVSLIGRDEVRIREIGEEVAREIQGEIVEAKRVGEGGSEAGGVTAAAGATSTLGRDKDSSS